MKVFFKVFHNFYNVIICLASWYTLIYYLVISKYYEITRYITNGGLLARKLVGRLKIIVFYKIIEYNNIIMYQSENYLFN